MSAMSAGQVSFFNFISGTHIYSMNTHVVYKYPSHTINECIDMCVRTEFYLKNNDSSKIKKRKEITANDQKSVYF